MAANVAVNATISARDAASKNIKTINKALAGLGKTAEGVKRDFQRLTMGVAAVAAGTAAFTVSAIKAAAEDEQASAKLTAALKARKLATDSVNAAIERQIQRGQDLAFTDDDVRASIEVSTRFTRKYSEATKIQNVAMELARATGMSLADATMAVGKAYSGTGAKALKGLGITKKNIKGQEALNAILNKTRGSAAAYADTTAGSFEVLGIKAAELKEQFGAAFLPAVTKLFKALAPELDKFAKWLENKVPAIRAFADNLVNKIIGKIPGFFQKIRDAVPVALFKIQEFIDRITGIGTEADKILGPGGKIRVLISGIGAALGGLKGVIAANLLSEGVDPLASYFTATVSAAIIEGVVKGLAAELVTKAVAGFAAKMAAASAAGSAASAVTAAAGGVAAGAVPAAAAVGGFSAATVAGAVVAPFAIAAGLKAAGVTQIAQSGIPWSVLEAYNKRTIEVNIGEKKVDKIVADSISRNGTFKRGR